jgi:hypothetical protein
MTTETAPAFKPDAIGSPGEAVEFEVERERIAAYAAATNDTIGEHASGELAPPVFSIVPAGEQDDRTAYAYETESDSGDVVIKDGRAEIA